MTIDESAKAYGMAAAEAKRLRVEMDDAWAIAHERETACQKAEATAEAARAALLDAVTATMEPPP